MAHVESLFRALRLVPIFVPASQKNGGIRDFLDDEEAALYDALPEAPADALRASLKDIQLQRVRLEIDREDGSIDEDSYRKAVLDVTDALRFVADALNKIEIAGKAGSGAADGVEMAYGSEKGPSYDKDTVERVRKKTEEAKAAPVEPPPVEEEK
jgi:hypothetical protein